MAALPGFGLSLLVGARWPLVLLPGVVAMIDRGLVEREERYLKARFGREYAEYRTRVRRWV